MLSSQDCSFKGKDVQHVFPESWKMEVIDSLVTYVICWASPQLILLQLGSEVASNLNDPFSRGYPTSHQKNQDQKNLTV